MANNFVPHSQVPYYNRNENTDYSNHRPLNKQALELAKPLARAAIAGINYNPTSGRAITIADYGTADGGVSMGLITYMIGMFKEKYGDGQEIQIQYEDQATADFNLLFRIIHGVTKKSTPSFLEQYKNIFVSACGTNFYAQCFSSVSIDIALCSASIQWLSKRPCSLKSSVLVHFSNDENEINCFTECAKNDYELFLTNRAKELVSGGYLIMCNMTRDSENQFETSNSQCKQWYAMLEKHWKSMCDDGLIMQEEFENTTINTYIMTKDEFKAPFENVTSNTYQSGLRLVSSNTVFIPCPVTAEWKKNENKDQGEARQYAKRLAMQTRVWSNSSYVSGLSNTRTIKEKNAIVDQFFLRYEHDIAKDPDEYRHDYLQTYLLIRKEC